MEISTAQPRFRAILLGGFASLSLLLAALGIFGVMSYAVSQRTREIGIRMALGAQRQAVLRLILGEGAKVGAAGVGIGLVFSLAFTRLMQSLLFGVSGIDPLTFASVAVLLAAVALAASYVPAYRAARVDPIVTLRDE